MWLRSSTTDLLAPIDAYPAPRGNVVVIRDGLGNPTGTYDVVPDPRPLPAAQAEVLLERDAYADLGGGLDVDEDPDDVLAPTRHVNHWVTCGSATARRLARERATKGVPAGPLRTVDGDPVGPRHVTEAATDPLGPPAVASTARRCRSCWRPLEAAASAAGDRFHPTCGPDPGPEPDRP